MAPEVRGDGPGGLGLERAAAGLAEDDVERGAVCGVGDWTDVRHSIVGSLLDLEKSLLAAHHAEKVRGLLRVPAECPKSPIFAVLSSEPKVLAAHCQVEGFTVRGIVPPTVPLGTERIRVCLHAGNTLEQVNGLVEVIRIWVEARSKALLRDAEAARPRL